MVDVICVVCGHYDVGTEIGAVFLWGTKTGVLGVNGANDDSGDTNDTANNTVLFWGGVADIGGGEFADFADAGGGDGVGVCDGSGSRSALSGNGAGVGCEDDVGFSYWGGGVFWWDATVCGGGGAGAILGVGRVWVYFIVCDMVIDKTCMV